MRASGKAGWAIVAGSANLVSFLEHEKITCREIPSKDSAGGEEFRSHFVHPDEVNPDGENPEIKDDADCADEVEQENPLTARTLPGSEDIPNRQKIIRPGYKHEGAGPADQIVQVQPIQEHREDRPFHDRAEAADQKILLGGYRNIRSPDATQTREPGWARVFQESFFLRKAVFLPG